MLFTEKMQKALAHYVVHGIKSDAYRHAYDTSGMTARSVHREAWELFRRPFMREAVAQFHRERAAKVQVDLNWVLERAQRLAEFNINTFLVTDGETGEAYYDFSKATDDDWYCISEYTVETIAKGRGDDRVDVDRVRLRPEAKQTALRLVKDILEGPVKKLELTGKDGGPIQTRSLNDFYAEQTEPESSATEVLDDQG